MLARTLGALLLSLLASSASAQSPRRVRFTYDLHDGSAVCPGEAKLRAGVNARLGYDAFDAAADEALNVELHRLGRELEAVVTLTDKQGRPQAERRLSSRQGDCTELAASVELAVSIAIDPFRMAAKPQPIPEPAPQPPEPVAPPAPAPEPLSGMLEVGALVAQGSLPERSLGLVLGGNARRGRWSLGLEARADLPRSHGLTVGTIRTYAVNGTLAPCVHFYGAAACALVSAGTMRAQGRGLNEARQITRATVATGARLAYLQPLSQRLALVFHGDLTTPLIRTELQVDHGVVWTTPPLAAALGIDLGLNFP